jgi:hypothetical protein
VIAVRAAVLWHSNGVPTLQTDDPPEFADRGLAVWWGVGPFFAGRLINDLDYHDAGVLHITLPDGTRVREPTGWPSIGPGGVSFIGRHEILPGRPKPPGTYTVQFEFAGLRTEPKTIVVGGEVPDVKDVPGRSRP